MNPFTPSPSKKSVDAVLIGMGAASCLLLLAMERRGWLRGKRIVVIEPCLDQLPQKTFCFWSSTQDSIQHDLKDVIVDSWSHCEVIRGQSESMAPYQYHCVESSDLWRQAQRVGERNQVIFIQGNAERVEENGQLGEVHVAGDVYLSQWIFDSRPPRFADMMPHTYHIHQSFVGWFIHAERHSIGTHDIRLMDFDIPQNGHCQFMYVIPFSDGRTLVEFTRFGSEKITPTEAQEQLSTYIKQHFGEVTRIVEEQGCIPMSNCPITRDEIDRIIPIGTRAGLLKPSTGYAFRSMYAHAEKCMDQLEQRDVKTVLTAQSASPSVFNRFAWYDKLLLHILFFHPEQGKVIFQALFSKVAPKDTFQFLDEETSIWQEVKIFFLLPKIPFLLAASYGWKKSSVFQPLLLFILSITLIILGFDSALQNFVGYTLMALGMIAVGMPHGAVDHLLVSGSGKDARVSYIFRYLALMLLMWGVWYFFPYWALIFFIAYSGWHFGSGDGDGWGLQRSLSWFWGISVLLFLFTTHAKETTLILSHMNIDGEVPGGYSWILLPWLLLALVKRNAHWVMTIASLMVASFIPLVFAFGLYFIGQHSWMGWQNLRIQLKQSSAQIWWSAFPFHIGAWLLFGMVLLFQEQLSSWSNYSVWGLFFIFLSCVSFPHVWFTHRYFTK